MIKTIYRIAVIALAACVLAGGMIWLVNRSGMGLLQRGAGWESRLPPGDFQGHGEGFLPQQGGRAMDRDREGDFHGERGGSPRGWFGVFNTLLIIAGVTLGVVGLQELIAWLRKRRKVAPVQPSTPTPPSVPETPPPPENPAPPVDPA